MKCCKYSSCTSNPFKAVIKLYDAIESYSVRNYKSLPPESNVCGQAQRGTLRVESTKGAPLIEASALPSNIRQGWKRWEVKSTLAYYGTSVDSFTVNVVSVLYRE
jgi:hypothetical protein